MFTTALVKSLVFRIADVSDVDTERISCKNNSGFFYHEAMLNITFYEC